MIYRNRLKPHPTPKWLTDKRLKINSLIKQRKEIEIQLINPPREMVKGILSYRYYKCGKNNCRCHNKKKPKLHGPYYYVSLRIGNKMKTFYLKDKEIAEKIKKYQGYYRAIIELKNINRSIEDEITDIKNKSTKDFLK